MKLLFPEMMRSRTAPHQRGELLFDFYNDCGGREYDEFRAIINKWISELPALDRAEMLSRMSLGGDRHFQSGQLELTIYSLIAGLKQRAIVHPGLKGTTKHPDFAVVDDNSNVVAYIEVTTINPASGTVSGDNREAAIYNAIDRIRLPKGCVFGYDLICAGTSSPPIKPLIKEIENWVKDELAKNVSGRITRRFETAGWEIELDFLSGGSIVHDRAIGIASGGFNWIAPHLDLRSALEAKAKRYGEMNAPYLIVVADAKQQLFGSQEIKDTVTEALLGDEVVKWRAGQKPTFARRSNGFWFRSESARNTNVSGVLFFPDIGLWGLRSEELQPILALNPWADRPLPNSFKSLSHFVADGDDWKFVLGKNFADVIGLPSIWPPPRSTD